MDLSNPSLCHFWMTNARCLKSNLFRGKNTHLFDITKIYILGFLEIIRKHLPSQLWLICSALWISRSWLTSRLATSAHSSWRNCDTRGVNRGNGPGFVASGLKPVEYRRARGAKILNAGVGDASLFCFQLKFSFWRKKIEVNFHKYRLGMEFAQNFIVKLPRPRRCRGDIWIIRW